MLDYSGTKRKMTFKSLKYFLLMAAVAVSAVSCDDDDDSTVYPSLSGLTFNCPLFVAPRQVVKMTPEGVTHPDGKGIGYYWKVSPSMPDADTTRLENGRHPYTDRETDGSLVFTFSDTLASYSVTCYAFASGYSGDSYTLTVAVVDGGLDRSITNTGILASDNHVTSGGTDYYYETIGGLDWFRNNLVDMDKGTAFAGEEVTSGVFGRYYSYEEALTACPEGWRLPTEEDWLALCASIGASSVPEYSTVSGVASKLFADARFNGEPMLEYWPAVGKITNESGISIIPSGFSNLGEKNQSGIYPSATFEGLYDYAVLWTADRVDGNDGMAYYRYLISDQPDFYVGKGDVNSFGASVRCVRDSE